ncbi:MAG: TMEM175 family protein [Candidatus Campbellbacteria bacterium]|nr:TMEM175 family protein [Candidatus Campbellbacteria bacterium]
MKQTRFDNLADGIFAIVMTLLALEIRVPALVGEVGNASVWYAVVSLTPHILSYSLSFLLLFTYWRGHHSIASVLAQNIDAKLTTINAFFFLLVGLVPFSTLLLGKYFFTQAAITLYGLNIICIGLLLYWMRQYIISSPTIRNMEMDPVQLQHSTLRILVPVYMSCIAILVSFLNVHVSLFLFMFVILFNLSGHSTTLLTKVFPKMFST